MALKSSAHETCSCVSPYAFKNLSSEQRQGLEILHQREVIITEAECKRIGRSSYGHPRCKVVAQIILAKTISESLRICEICEQYQLLDSIDTKPIKVLVDVYHKEQLVTKEEAEEAASDEWRWENVAITKDVSTATRIADILDKYGCNYYAQHMRVLVDVYHKEQLVTKEEAEKVASKGQSWVLSWEWSQEWRWVDAAVTKDVITAARIADILDKYGFNNVARHIRFLVNVYHKEQLVTKEEAEKAASDIQSWEWRWVDAAVTKDASSAARIADILDKHGFNDVAQHIREPSSTIWPLLSRGYDLIKVSRSVLQHKEPSSTKWPLLSRKHDLAHSRSLDPTSEQYATSDTSVLDTSISKTSPDIDSSEPKSQEKATVTSELDTTSKKELYVGKLNVIEQVHFESNLWTCTLKTFISLFHDMSHEAILTRNCWIPFGHDSITVDRRGGTYDLCSDGLTKLTVPRHAVRGETAEIRYAIIGKGPFQLPPNYQLGSFVVYVHYNPEEITRPITLSLPTWYGGDVVPGEPPPDGLSFAVAPHTLGLRDTQYTFQLVDGGEFHDSRVHDVSIDGHSSNYTIVFKEGAKSLYLATHLMVKNNAEETTHRICMTYFCPIWRKIFKAIYKKATLVGSQHFEFENPPSGKLVAVVEETRGNGWAVTIVGSLELHQRDVSYEKYGFTTAKEFESAVNEELYPPKLSFHVANTVGRGEQTTPNLVNFTIRGAKSILQFSACVKERISGSDQRTPQASAPSDSRSSSSPNPPPPSLHNPVFDSEQFMDNFKERFLRVVAAKDIAEKLKTKGVIPESVHCHFVNPQTTDSDANLKLFRHLHQHGAPSIIRSLCDIMIQERGYPNMNTLGREMSAHTSLPPS